MKQHAVDSLRRVTGAAHAIFLANAKIVEVASASSVAPLTSSEQMICVVSCCVALGMKGELNITFVVAFCLWSHSRRLVLYVCAC